MMVDPTVLASEHLPRNSTISHERLGTSLGVVISLPCVRWCFFPTCSIFQMVSSILYLNLHCVRLQAAWINDGNKGWQNMRRFENCPKLDSSMVLVAFELLFVIPNTLISAVLSVCNCVSAVETLITSAWLSMKANVGSEKSSCPDFPGCRHQNHPLHYHWAYHMHSQCLLVEVNAISTSLDGLKHMWIGIFSLKLGLGSPCKDDPFQDLLFWAAKSSLCIQGKQDSQLLIWKDWSNHTSTT